MPRGLDEGCDQRELRMGFGVASKESERGVDVAQGAERGVHGRMLEDRARVEDALQLCGCEAPLLCTTNAANRRGGACISCRGGSELADAGAESGEDGRGRDASGLGEVIAVGAGHLVDQAVGTQQAEFATGPG